MHELRHLSSLDDVHRLWLQAYVARADLAGFQVCQVPDLAGFRSRQVLVADVKGRCLRQVLAVRDSPCMSEFRDASV